MKRGLTKIIFILSLTFCILSCSSNRHGMFSQRGKTRHGTSNFMMSKRNPSFTQQTNRAEKTRKRNQKRERKLMKRAMKGQRERARARRKHNKRVQVHYSVPKIKKSGSNTGGNSKSKSK